MISAKKISLQLTPLLDLLLIVIFAQFLEMEQKSATDTKTQAAQHSQLVYEVDELKQKLAFSESVLELIQEKRITAEKLATSLEQQHKSSQQQAAVNQQEYQQRLQELTEQRNRIISAIRDAFANSSQELEQILEKMAASAATSPTLPKEQIEQLAKQLTKTEAYQMVTFLMAYEEIRKRCDIWEVHLDEQGVANIFANQQQFKVRVKSQENFQEELYGIYKSLPQPKGLVIMLISYEEVARSVRESLLLSLPDVTNRMREDADGRSRFEYAVIGYLPKTAQKKKPESIPKSKPKPNSN